MVVVHHVPITNFPPLQKRTERLENAFFRVLSYSTAQFARNRRFCSRTIYVNQLCAALQNFYQFSGFEISFSKSGQQIYLPLCLLLPSQTRGEKRLYRRRRATKFSWGYETILLKLKLLSFYVVVDRLAFCILEVKASPLSYQSSLNLAAPSDRMLSSLTCANQIPQCPVYKR